MVGKIPKLPLLERNQARKDEAEPTHTSVRNCWLVTKPGSASSATQLDPIFLVVFAVHCGWRLSSSQQNMMEVM